tara:strand:+ start:225 stop:497 length:273 start_codon:yes stop_codon:yes gene_type:complete
MLSRARPASPSFTVTHRPASTRLESHGLKVPRDLDLDLDLDDRRVAWAEGSSATSTSTSTRVKRWAKVLATQERPDVDDAVGVRRVYDDQ